MGRAQGDHPASRLAVALDHPWLPALLMLLGGLALVVVRMRLTANGDVSAFIIPGMDYAQQAALPAGIHVVPNTGYDGQFFYRLALDPAAFSGAVHGIRLDTPYRLQRIGYPALAWVTALGRVRWVPWSLIGVNLASLGGLGLVGGILARDNRRHALWGLLLAGYWGYAFSVTRDVAEVPAAFFLMAGLLALRRDRPVLTGLLLAAAVLTRETALAVVGAVGVMAVVELAQRWRHRELTLGPALLIAQLPWMIPTFAFAYWQAFIRHFSGTEVAGADVDANLGKPFVAAIHAVQHELATLGQRASEMALGEVVALTVITGMALWAWRSSSAGGETKLAWIVVLGLVACLSAAVWSGSADFRSLDELFLLDVFLLLGSKMRLWVPGGLCALALGVVAVHQVLNY